MNNHYICVEYWLCSTCVSQFLNGNPLFGNHVFLMNFEFLSTTFNQGTIIRKENMIIVNKINKFNVSWFRNTQAHSQRSSQCGERSNQSHVQILDFWTLISRIDSTPLKTVFQFTALRKLPKSFWFFRIFFLWNLLENPEIVEIRFLAQLRTTREWHMGGVRDCY